MSELPVASSSRQSTPSVVESSPAKRKDVSFQFKLDVVRFAEKTSNSAVAKKFGVDHKQIQRWRKSKKTLEESCGSEKGKSQCLPGGGRTES